MDSPPAPLLREGVRYERKRLRLRARTPLPVTPAGRRMRLRESAVAIVPLRCASQFLRARAMTVITVPRRDCDEHALEPSGSSHFTSPTSIRTPTCHLCRLRAPTTASCSRQTQATRRISAPCSRTFVESATQTLPSVSLAADGSSEAWAAPSCRDIHTWFPAVPSGALASPTAAHCERPARFSSLLRHGNGRWRVDSCHEIARR